MKGLIRQPHQGRSGYIALIGFLLVYTAAMAFVIAPDRVKSAMETDVTWPLD